MGVLYGNSAESGLVDYMVRLKLPPLGSEGGGGRVEALNPEQGPRLHKSGPLSTVEVRTIGTIR
jgi:hypothetical protein